MAEKAQKVCIHTNVITQVNSLIKIVERVYDCGGHNGGNLL